MNVLSRIPLTNLISRPRLLPLAKKRLAESKGDVTEEPRTANTESSETKESCRDPSTAHSSENPSITQKAETQENIFTTEKGKKKEKRGPKLLLEVRLERQTLSGQRPSSTGECVVRSLLRQLAILEKPRAAKTIIPWLSATK